ncbi:MAG: DUF6770 family protein [Bacteroidota bacterium]
MKKVLTAFLLMASVVFCVGQSLEYTEVEKPNKFKGVEPIDGLGYFAFMIDGKASRKEKIYNFYIWDYDLSKIAETKEILPKYSEILDSDFNGTSFLIAALDTRREEITLITYDLKGKKIASKLIDDYKLLDDNEDWLAKFYADPGNGYYGIIPGKNKGYGFTLVKYDNKLKEVWSKPYFTKKTVQTIFDAKSDEGKFVVIKSDAGKMSQKRAEIEITAYDSEKGSTLWSFDLNEEDRICYPTEFAFNEKGEIAVAGMYFLGEKLKAKNSDGIFFKNINPDGKVIAESYQAWEGELQEFLKATRRKSLTVSKAKVVFDDIIFDQKSGKIIVVGELFTIGADRSIGGLLAGGSIPLFNLENILVFTFNQQAELLDFYDVKKARDQIGVPYNNGNLGVKAIGFAKKLKMLAYRYQTFDDDGNILIFYRDYVKVVDGNAVSAETYKFNQFALGILNLSESSGDNISNRLIPLSVKTIKKLEEQEIEIEKRDIIYITESKIGKVLISTFNRKEKSLTLNLLDIN